MAIKGNLREASLADVLQLLALGRKSGCLSVSDRNNFGQIYFDQGMISYAAIVNRRDRMGDLLVKNSIISAEELSAAVGEQVGQNPPRLGEILIRRGSITRKQLEHYIRIQIEEAVYFLFTWNQGTFYFEPGETPDPADVTVSINPEGLLLEGARRVDEWTLIEKKVAPDLVFAVDRSHGEPEAAELTEAQRRILPLIDGRRSVRDIIEDSGLLEFETCKAVFGLVQAGFARHRGKKREAALEEVRPGRLREHSNLGIAFFRTSMLEEAEREFRRVLELDPAHRESQFHLGLIALKRGETRQAIRQFMRLIEAGGVWASSFHNLALALEMAGRLDDALLTVQEALRDFPGDRSLLLARGILLTRLGDFASACEAFDVFASMPGRSGAPPTYYAYSMVALGGAGRLREARDRAREGVVIHPGSAQVLVNAAAVHERGGEIEEAESLYARAVEDSPDLHQARRGLADALYRRGAYDDAGVIYQQLASNGAAGSADILFKLGNIAYKRGDRAAALNYWRETVEADPDHAVARTNLELVGSAPASTNR